MKLFRDFLYGVVIVSVTQLAFAQPRWCEPKDSCWPREADWQRLEKQLTGKLLKPVSAIEPCLQNSQSDSCKQALKQVHNPFFLESTPGNSQSQGWLNAWVYKNSIYAVEAATTEDIVAAVNFARTYHIRLVVKGTGHDYLGRSNAADSLLIWTHNMREVSMAPNFVPKGCPIKDKGEYAVNVSAGNRWIEVYTEVTTRNGRYVQGGGCTTVGAAGGFIQGGGFGSFSKRYGTGAGGILEAEVVTADGKVLTANRCQNQDLFWALRGGGASTFGVVSHITLLTHELPAFTGILQGSISASDDKSYQKLLTTFIPFIQRNLNNEHWGEQITFSADNKINLFLVYQGNNQQEVDIIWKPIKDFVNNNSKTLSIKTEFWSIPPTKLWDLGYWKEHYPQLITENEENGKITGQYWWAPNSQEVYKYWFTYQSWWLPEQLFKSNKQLVELIYNASRVSPTSLHLNKGLSGAVAKASDLTKATAMNPNVLNAVALLVIAEGNNQVYPGISGMEPNLKQGVSILERINRIMNSFIEAVPDAGTYVNEADYFLKNWQKAFWGSNFAKLLEVKKKYDPNNLFQCHHCVGT